MADHTLLLHARRAEDPRADRRRTRSATSCSSTRVRINLGLVQPDVDVFWDLAPHDLSILDFILPGGLGRAASRRTARTRSAPGKSCVGYLTMPLPGGAIAHVHVNWLSPTKIRQMVIGGTQRTLVWDDLNPAAAAERLRPRRRPRRQSRSRRPTGRAANISYRLGDTWSPALPEREALRAMVAEFAGSIREQRARAHRRRRRAAGPVACSRRPAGSLSADGAPLASSPATNRTWRSAR